MAVPSISSGVLSGTVVRSTPQSLTVRTGRGELLALGVDEGTRVEGLPAGQAQLPEGAPVRASYVLFERGLVARTVIVLPETR